MERLTFIPGKGINDLLFGLSPEELPTAYNFVFAPYLSAMPLKTRSFVSKRFGLRVDFDSNRLVTISCSNSIILNGEELIGSKFREVGCMFSSYEKISDQEYVLIGDGRQQIIYINQLGLSIWIDSSDTIKTVDCIENCEL